MACRVFIRETWNKLKAWQIGNNLLARESYKQSLLENEKGQSIFHQRNDRKILPPNHITFHMYLHFVEFNEIREQILQNINKNGDHSDIV